MKIKNDGFLKYLRIKIDKLIYKFPTFLHMYIINPLKTKFIVSNFLKVYDHNKVLKLYYDTAISPPTYGDFLNLLMLGRFFALSGRKVKIQIVNSGPRKGNYKINLRTHNAILSEYIAIGKKVLPKNIGIEIVKKFTLLDNEVTFDSKVMFFHAPRVIHILTKHYFWEMPSNFLLLKKDKKLIRPYITWGLRYGAWHQSRNTEANEIIKDYKMLRSLFPNSHIMVLTTNKGWYKISKVLKEFHDDSSFSSDQRKIVCQPHFGFSKAIEYLVESNFYFQRNGSGLGTVAHYSNTPYLLLASERNYEYSLFQKSYIKAQKSQQKFKVVKIKDYDCYKDIEKLF